ncbi:hypothetical protein ACWCO3_33695, partial [Micromonospora sp. NPDC002411]
AGEESGSADGMLAAGLLAGLGGGAAIGWLVSRWRRRDPAEPLALAEATGNADQPPTLAEVTGRRTDEPATRADGTEPTDDPTTPAETAAPAEPVPASR